jgi:hypothetical protein
MCFISAVLILSKIHYHHWQNSPFWALALLRRFCQIESGCHFFGFCNNNFYFTEQGHQPCIQPPVWWTRSLYLCPSVSEWPSYTPSYQVPFLSPMTPRAMVEVPDSTRGVSIIRLDYFNCVVRYNPRFKQYVCTPDAMIYSENCKGYLK